MKTNATQIIILGIFIVFLIIGIFIFSMAGSSSGGASDTQVQIWGTIPDASVARVVDTVNNARSGTLNIFYREIPEQDFEQTLIEALADGGGPDVVLMPSNMILKNQKKLLTIGTDFITTRDFKDSFNEASEIFLTSKGTYALPLYTDPMVMYWNRDMLTAKNVARPPQTWEEVLKLVNIVTDRREDKSILKSAVALGDYTNIPFSKNIIITLLMQAGGKLIEREVDDAPVNMLVNNLGMDTNPLTASLSFYTQFSNPVLDMYSWNRSLPDAETAFTNGDVAFFFAPTSEAKTVRTKNPNLNFDITTMPQPKTSTLKRTFGTVYGMSIIGTSKNANAAFATMQVFTSKEVAAMFSNNIGVPPARRDLLAEIPGNTFGAVFWQSALWAKAWLDPDPVKTEKIFRDGVDSVVTGKSRPEEASKTVSKQIGELLD